MKKMLTLIMLLMPTISYADGSYPNDSFSQEEPYVEYEGSPLPEEYIEKPRKHYKEYYTPRSMEYIEPPVGFYLPAPLPFGPVEVYVRPRHWDHGYRRMKKYWRRKHMEYYYGR